MKPIRSLALGVALALGAAAQALAASAISTGTTLYGTLSTDLNTSNASIGQGFSVNVTSPYPNGDTSYAGAYIRGHVASVVKAGQGQKAALGLAFDRIVLANGTSSALSGHVIQIQQRKQSAIPQQAIGAGVGMLVGNALGKMVFGSGMHMGGLAGAAGGYVYANNMKTNFTVPKGSPVQIQIDREVARPQAHH